MSFTAFRVDAVLVVLIVRAAVQACADSVLRGPSRSGCRLPVSLGRVHFFLVDSSLAMHAGVSNEEEAVAQVLLAMAEDLSQEEHVVAAIMTCLKNQVLAPLSYPGCSGLAHMCTPMDISAPMCQSERVC